MTAPSRRTGNLGDAHDVPELAGLQISEPAPSNRFPQQGQVDWVSFGKTLYSISAAALQRFSNAHVQPSTYAAGRALASRFNIGEMGEKRMSDAMKSLSRVAGLDGMLYFGFGHQSFIKLLAEDVRGLELIGLCGSLSEIHSETMIAWILRDLWKLEGFPDTYRPPQTQFAALARACSGVLARTSFAKTVEQMHRGVWDDHSKARIMASPSMEVAKALIGLFQISRGEVASMHVVGQSECAFIAGLAHWLFDLTVRVENEHGKLVYTNTSENDVPHVLVQYTNDRDIAAGKSLYIERTTYILGTHYDMMMHTPDTDLLNMTMRVPWETCLSRLMGRETYGRFVRNPRTVGSFLGSLVRLHGSMVKGKTFFAMNMWRQQSDLAYISRTYTGRRFIDQMTHHIPELRKLTDLLLSMESAAMTTESDELANLDFHLMRLKSVCECCSCHSGKSTSVTTCLVSYSLAIYRLVTVLICTKYDACLMPTLAGLETLHMLYDNVWLDLLTNTDVGVNKLERSDPYFEDGEEAESPFQTFVCSIFSLHSKSKFVPSLSDTSPLLADVTLIFTGMWPKIKPSQEGRNSSCTAVAQLGVCVYLDWLRSPNISTDLSLKVNVIPGHIEWQNKEYDFVFDALYAESISPKVPLASLSDPQKTSQGIVHPARVDQANLQTLVSERSSDTELAYFYKATVPDGNVWLQPGQLSQKILHSSAYVFCDKVSCSGDFILPCTVIERGWEMSRALNDSLTYRDNVACCVWLFEDDISRCAALTVINNARDPGKALVTIVRADQCISCCLKFVFRTMGELVSPTVVHIL